MKKVEVKTPLGLETFLFLDGALVRPEDLHGTFRLQLALRMAEPLRTIEKLRLLAKNARN